MNSAEPKKQELIDIALTSVAVLPRCDAIESLLEHWPDDDTRQFVAERAANDKDALVRWAIMNGLTKRWPDNATRAIIETFIDEDYGHDEWNADELAAEAIELLRSTWPDETTIAFLIRQLDVGGYSAEAMQSLVKGWGERFTQDYFESRYARSIEAVPTSLPIEWMAKQWPNDQMLRLLQELADRHPEGGMRKRSIEALGANSTWLTSATRSLCIKLAAVDLDGNVRESAMDHLSNHWPDDEARMVFERRLQIDELGSIRRKAMEALRTKWPDEKSRILLEASLIEPSPFGSNFMYNFVLRVHALRNLAQGWPDVRTRQLLGRYAVNATHRQFRRVAFTALLEMHSNFGRELGIALHDYDPLEPLPKAIFVQAARRQLDLKHYEEIDLVAAELSDFVGWNLLLGAENVIKRSSESLP